MSDKSDNDSIRALSPLLQLHPTLWHEAMISEQDGWFANQGHTEKGSFSLSCLVWNRDIYHNSSDEKNKLFEWIHHNPGARFPSRQFTSHERTGGLWLDAVNEAFDASFSISTNHHDALKDFQRTTKHRALECQKKRCWWKERLFSHHLRSIILDRKTKNLNLASRNHWVTQ